MTLLKYEENAGNFNQQDIDRFLKEHLSDKEFMKYKKLFNRLENITSLVFSLETRFNEKKISNSKDGLVMLMYQIKNAKEIFEEHEENVDQFVLNMKKRFNDVQICTSLTKLISSKTQNLCLRRALVRELYFIHLKFDICNLL